MAELKVRDSRLDFAKGIGIFLVVVGHVAIAKVPENADWCERLMLFIYTFHMPAFMALTGYVSSAFTRKISSVTEYKSFVWHKFLRLMIPHFILAIIVYSIKYYLGEVNSGQKPFQGIWQIYFDPMRSSVIFLWFIYLVFIFSLVTPLLQIKSRIVWLMLALFALSAYAWSNTYRYRPPELSLLILCAHFFLYYIFGYGVHSLVKRYDVLKNVGKYSLFIFTLASFWYLFIADITVINQYVAIRHSLAWISVFALLWIFGQNLRNVNFHNYALGRFFATLGIFSFPIYLMNTTILGGVKVVLIKCGIAWDASMLLLHIVIGSSVALLLPIFIQRFVIERTPIIRSIFRR